jgi:hypothetical protein
MEFKVSTEEKMLSATLQIPAGDYKRSKNPAASIFSGKVLQNAANQQQAYTVS